MAVDGDQCQVEDMDFGEDTKERGLADAGAIQYYATLYLPGKPI